MKKNKKKLPKFWLGTRMPNSLGYQPNYGIGGYLYTSKLGESVLPEINTVKSNTIPGALNKLQTNSSFAINALKDIVKPTTIGTTVGAVNSAALNAAAVGGVGARLTSPGAGANYMGSMGTVGGLNILATGTNAAANEGVKLAAIKSTLGTLGKVTAGIGTLYGGIDMGMQIAANKDHRTAADMRNTLTTNTYTTDLGNTYTSHSGVDRAAELDYAKKQKLAKNLNFTATSIGTGMSAGALAGSLIGSVAPGVGTAIGAGVGALVGLGANLFGFGDTEEETKAAMDRLTDVTSMEDKMSYSLALNKDAQQGFYGRTKSGSLGAKNGKRPIYARNGKGNAMVSHGEVIGNLNEGWAYREPGIPDNNDTLKRHIKPTDFVISNKYGLSDYAAATGDYVGALKAQDVLMSDKYMMNGRNTDLLFLAKCGKLPKYSGGTTIQTIAASVPRIAGLLSNWLYANALRHADKSTSIEEINDYGANDVPYQMMSNLPYPRVYLNRSDRNYKNALYNIQRNPGLGHGGRAIAAANAYVQKQAQDAEILSSIDEIRRQLINEALKLKYNEAQRMSNLKHDSWWRSREDRNKITSTYNNLMAQIPANIYTIGSDWAKDIAGIYQYGRAMDLLEDLNDIYRNSAESLNISAYANLWNTLNNANKNNKSSVSLLTPVDLLKQYPWLSNDPNLMRAMYFNKKPA